MHRFLICLKQLSVLLLFLAVTFDTLPAQTDAAVISAVAVVENPIGLIRIDVIHIKQSRLPSNSLSSANESSAKFMIYAPEPENTLIAVRYENDQELQVYSANRNGENEEVIQPGPSPTTAILDLNTIIDNNSSDSTRCIITIYNVAI